MHVWALRTKENLEKKDLSNCKVLVRKLSYFDVDKVFSEL